MTKAKASDVRYESAELAPIAKCRGVVRYLDGVPAGTTTECYWEFQSHLGGSIGGSTVGHARRHAQDNPGHEIEVVRTTRSVYWVDAPELREPSQ